MSDALTKELDAVRALVEALEPLDADARERAMRWAAEKLQMRPLGSSPATGALIQGLNQDQSVRSPMSAARDIKAFVQEKNPRSDNQFAAVVAYYFKFEAPESERKDTVTGDDLQESCRKASRARLKSPAKTLNNAFIAGYFDKVGAGGYRLNTVGENLVAMVLPSATADVRSRTPSRKPAKSKERTPRKTGRA